MKTNRKNDRVDSKYSHAFLQWEGLQFPLKATRLDPSTHLLSGSVSATVSRDNSYYLHSEVEGIATGTFGPFAEVEQKQKEAFSISGSRDHYAISLYDCHIIDCEISYDPDLAPGMNNTFSADVITNRVEQNIQHAQNETTHIDWFLNGPRGFTFPRKTFLENEEIFIKILKDFPAYTMASGRSHQGTHNDCAFIQTPTYSFLIRSVPSDFEPVWSNNVGIEYSRKLSNIPDEDTREAISEIVSFVLGRRLIDIGDTSFSSEEWPFLKKLLSNTNRTIAPVGTQYDSPFHMRSWNPRGINIRSLCSKIDYPPVPVDKHRYKSSQNIESVLTKVLPVYLKLRKALDLDHTLWRYWTFQELPMGVNLPMLVNAIEILTNAWFKSPFSNSHGTFTSKEPYLCLLKSEFEIVREKLAKAGGENPCMENLKDPKVLNAMMNRLENSFAMGSNARTRQFFIELGLELSDEENAALSSRNQQLHARSEKATNEELWKNSEILRTLFYKVFLRILNYSGEYLDWSYQKPQVKQLDPFKHVDNYYREIGINYSSTISVSNTISA